MSVHGWKGVQGEFAEFWEIIGNFDKGWQNVCVLTFGSEDKDG
jgi:hypothetical protein